jgi:uncharacterized protein (TIGR03118 family)
MDAQRKAVAGFKAVLAGAALAAGLMSCGDGGSSDNDQDNNTPVAATTFTTSSLVSDGTLTAAHTDTALVNAWGLAFNPDGYAWVANNGSDTATQYDGSGLPLPLAVSIPAGTGGNALPTGIVHNGSEEFRVRLNGVIGPSVFLFAGENGTISGWSPAVDPTAAVTVFDGGADGPVYKGLAIASYAGANYLYAADFRNNAIDVYDGKFTRVRLPGGFRDPGMPDGYAPFGIQAIGDRIYVAFAQRSSSGTDEIKGAGLGVIDVFDTSGVFIEQLVTGGALNAPWGMVIAPGNFGTFSGDLLVANFGDGKINAYNPRTGALQGTLSLADGTPIIIDGLWGLAFGNGVNAQPTNSLFFTAGPADEVHGQFGRIDMRVEPTVVR